MDARLDKLRRYKDTQALVTGGAGFVGSQVTKALLEIGAYVTVLDNFFTGRRENLIEHDNLKVIEGCVTDTQMLDDLIPKQNYVFHLAARNIMASLENPVEDLRVNAGGTLEVLKAVRDKGKKIERIIYSSSSSVYGNPQHLPISESDNISCLSPYSVSKLSGEAYCRVFYEVWQVPVCALRLSNVYGDGQSVLNPYCGVVAKFIEQAIQGRPITVHGDGMQTRDYTYVSDVVDAMLMAGLSPKSEGEIFNVGTGVETSVLDLISLISTLSGMSVEIQHISHRDIDNVRRRVLNIEKIRSRLRWTPVYNTFKGLQSTFKWLGITSK